VAKAWAELMRRLGYDRYVAHGGDFGAMVSRELGLAHPERVAALLSWLTGTAGSSARYYKEGTSGAWGEPEPPSPVPTAVAVLPHDIAVPIRRLAERNHNIVRWTEYDRGGHFAAMEEPDLLVGDLRESSRSYRS
jgi:pimeloyl-ACP methyl ester carboxylesterase